jgi:hypothetical protein
MSSFFFDFFAMLGVLQFGFWLWAFAITDLSGRSGRFFTHKISRTRVPITGGSDRSESIFENDIIPLFTPDHK